MNKFTEELSDNLKEKLNYIGLDLENIPKFLKGYEPLEFAPYSLSDNNEYRVYQYVPISDIQILVTPKNRTDDLKIKYNLASPISSYISPEKEEMEKGFIFLSMLDKITKEGIEEIDEIQKTLDKEVPYKIKYEKNYLWQIYYTVEENKYFMLAPADNPDYNNLFYLLRKQIKNSKESVFVPVCNLDYSSKYVKKADIREMENYLWLLTKDWPLFYEVYDKNKKPSFYIVGQTNIYENIKSLYRVILDEREMAQNFVKLVKALFILQTEVATKYKFDTRINQESSLEFYYKDMKITYENLSEFIKNEYLSLQKEMEINKKNKGSLQDTLNKIKEIVNDQEEQYLKLQKEISTYLEYKKTFLGKVRYFFKYKKATKVVETEEKYKDEKKKKTNNANEIQNKTELQREYYSIEDLVSMYSVYKKEKDTVKDMNLDIKSLELKTKNLERKIKNATIYINEINNHKKSIFEFWKFANKDELKSLDAGGLETKSNSKKVIKRVFDCETDLEDLGSQMDRVQRDALTKEELNSIFIANSNFLDVLNSKISEEEKLEQLKEEIEEFNKNEFSVLGDAAGEKQELIPLSNKKHRETKKNKIKVLDLSKNTSKEDFEDEVQKMRNNIETAIGKVVSKYNMPIYKALPKKQKLETDIFDIYNLNLEEELENCSDKEIHLIKLNIKENMPIVYYTNILFYDNTHRTLPLGMDISTNVLLNCNKFKFNLVSTTKIKTNNYSTRKENYLVKDVVIQEYDLEDKNKEELIDRAIIFVLDGFGVGELPDAYEYEDQGSNTLRGIYENTNLNLPNMKKLGLYNIDGVDVGEKESEIIGAYGKAVEQSKGKNSPVGHWEIAGYAKPEAFKTYKNGFPEELIEEFKEKANLEGILCNKVGSGTDLLKQYGEEHVKTGYPIIYTSADSVFQIAAHEDIIPLERLYEICKIAREILDNPKYDIGTVIARPFVGTNKDDFKRTYNRKDFNNANFGTTMLDVISKEREVIGIGKIEDLYVGKGITKAIHTDGNKDGIEKTLECIKKETKGLIFTNLIDFDMLYGHRNDIKGYGLALEYFDSKIPEIIESMKKTDILIITADHGNDPSFKGTDHTREYVPILVYGENIHKNINIGTRQTFADISATILDIFGMPSLEEGTSFKGKILDE